MKNRNALICGVGINDSDYPVKIGKRWQDVDGNQRQKQLWVCPFYQKWKSMLERCYSKKELDRHETYLDCYVCEEWLTFSKFKMWMETQDWQGNQLDKDLLFEGNNVYSPDKCLFVNQIVNKFILDSGATRGEYLIGCDFCKSSGKFRARCGNPFTGKSEHLGYFVDELSAHLAWKKRKHELSCELADSEYVTDPRLASALRSRFTNKNS